MKKVLFIILTITLLACDNATKETQKKLDETSVPEKSSILKEFSYEPTTFSFNGNRDTAITTKSGLKIHFEDRLFIDNQGEIQTDEIRLEIIELLDKSDFVFNNAPTISDERILESGGAYNIECFNKSGNKLNLIKGKTLKVELPITSKKEMELFYGSRLENGMMNWKKSDIQLTDNIDIDIICDELWGFTEDSEGIIIEEHDTTICDTTYINKSLDSKLYKVIRLENLGWINCDRFINVKEKTDLIVELKDTTITTCNIYIVFDEINSVMQNHYYSQNNKKHGNTFKNVPVGSSVNLIAISNHHGQLKSFRSRVQIKEGLTRIIELKKCSESEIAELFN